MKAKDIHNDGGKESGRKAHESIYKQKQACDHLKPANNECAV